LDTRLDGGASEGFSLTLEGDAEDFLAEFGRCKSKVHSYGLGEPRGDLGLAVGMPRGDVGLAAGMPRGDVGLAVGMPAERELLSAPTCSGCSKSIAPGADPDETKPLGDLDLTALTFLRGEVT
jgi:hypothetical protein